MAITVEGNTGMMTAEQEAQQLKLLRQNMRPWKVTSPQGLLALLRQSAQQEARLPPTPRAAILKVRAES